MNLILMEAGTQNIIVNQQTQQYFFLDKTAWQQLHQATIDTSFWQQGNDFIVPCDGDVFTDNSVDPEVTRTVGEDVRRSELIDRFINPEKNSGFMVAMRECEQPEIKIIDKRRYRLLKQLY